MAALPAPYHHFLVPLDGSTLAESALPAAAGLAAILGAHVTLIHLVEERAPAKVHGEPHLTDAASAEEYLARVARESFDQGSTVTWHVHTWESRDIAQGLVDLTRELGADLVVMCSHGRGGLRQLIVGSIAQRVIALGETTVLLIPPAAIPKAPPMKFRRLLVPLDGQAAHEEGLRGAAQLAAICGASLHLLAVVPTLTTLAGEDVATGLLLPGATSAILDLAEEESTAYLERLVARLEQQGIDAAARVARGEETSSIIHAAAEAQADLIVLATHGKAGLNAFWAGSVAAKVARRSERPLLLIPVDDRPRHHGQAE